MTDQLVALVAEYCAEHRHPERAPFIVHEPVQWKGWWGSEMSARPGCYVIYTNNWTPLYLGKASLKATVGSRLAAHERSKDERWSAAAHVQVIEVSEAFEAPSLEEFLLARLPTEHNYVGVVRGEKPILVA